MILQEDSMQTRHELKHLCKGTDYFDEKTKLHSFHFVLLPFSH